MSHPEIHPPAYAEYNASPERARPVYGGVIDVFKDLEVYDPHAPATVYLRERVAQLYKDEYEREGEGSPEVYIIKDDTFNAFRIGNVIGINSGALEKIRYDEELIGLAGHERLHFEQGSSCRFEKSGDNIGQRRVKEIEADVGGMKRMDDRGFNPMGMVSLADLMTSLEQPSRKGANLHSVVHGASLERKITLEQVLTAVDAKNLSDNLRPVIPLDLGQVVKVGDEAFWNLTPAIQQALLNRAVNPEYPSQRHIGIQKRILESVSPYVESETTLLQKAKLIVNKGYNSHDTEQPPSSTAQLRQDLDLLQSENTRILLPARQRCDAVDGTVQKHLHDALHSQAENFEDLTAIAKIVTSAMAVERGRNDGVTFDSYWTARLPIRDILKDTDLQAMSEAERLLLAKKLIHYGKLTGINSQEFFDLAVQGRDVSNVEIVEGLKLPETPLNTLLKEVMYVVESAVIAEINNQSSVFNKLKYIVNKYPGEASAALAGLGGGMRHKDFTSGGAFRDELAGHLQKERPEKILDQMVAEFRNGGSHNSIHEISGLVLELASINLNARTDSRQHLQKTFSLKELKGYLPFASLCRPTGQVSYSEFSAYQLVFDEALSSDRTINSYPFQRLKSIIRITDKLKREYPDLPWKDFDQEIRESSALSALLVRDALNSYFTPEGGDKLVTLLQTYSIPRLQRNKQVYKTDESLKKAIANWQKIAESLLSQADLETNEDSLMALAAIGMAAPEVEINLTVPSYAFQRLARGRDFEGGLKLLQDFPHIRSVHRSVLEVLIEEKARTTEDLEKLKDLVETLYIDTLADNYGLLGMASIADSIAIPFYSNQTKMTRDVGIRTDIIEGMQSSELLAGLLSSGLDDSRLKHYVAERWWLAMRAGVANEHFKVESYITYRYPGKERLLKHWLENDYPGKGEYTPFDNNMSHLYLLTDAARFFGVRKLLLESPNGVLMSEEGNKDLVASLMNSWLAAQEGTDEGIILKNLLINLISKNDPATSYLHVGPMLQDMILKPPKNPTDPEAAIARVADSVVDVLASKGRIKNVTAADYENMRYRVSKLFLGDGTTHSKDELQDLKANMLQRIGIDDSASSAEKLSTLAFAALAGKKAGGIGVKMLQLAGQYFELTEEERNDFDEVYDDMKGQTRLQAYNTFKREAAENSEAAHIFNQIEEFGERIGGGSLFTVYKIRLKDGREMALGIKNPNAEYRVRRLVEFLSTGLEETITGHPENSTLQLISSLMDDAVKWVANELDDPEFSHKDAVYRQENDTVVGSGFQKGRTRYDVITPKTVKTGTQWVRCEEFIEGTNLNSLRITEDGQTDIPSGIISRDDYKEAASVLVRNYMHQVMVGNYAHSDIHQGQFRITSDNSRIAIFDRYNLLPVSRSLRNTLRTAFTAIMDGDVARAALAIGMHGAPANTDQNKLSATINAIAENTDEPARLIADTILALKRAGIKIPLDLSLMLRNFMSINEFSKKAGFDNLAEAFLHTSSGMDELIRLAQTD